VTANDVDSWAGAAIAINASINHCSASIDGVALSIQGTGHGRSNPLGAAKAMEYGSAHGGGGGAEARPGGAISIELRDIVGLSRRELGDVDVLIAGDVMYEDAFAARVTGWLEHLSYQGCTVLVGDPGRHFLDKSRLVELAAYPLPQVRRWRKEAEGGERGERESERK
jgi:predicted nicotinamide N-methyase